MYGVGTYTDTLYGGVRTLSVSNSTLLRYRILLGIDISYSINYKIWGGNDFSVVYGLGGYCRADTLVNYNLLSVKKSVKCSYAMGGKMLAPITIVYGIDYRVSNIPFTFTWKIDPSDGMIVDRNKTSISTFSRTFIL